LLIYASENEEIILFGTKYDSKTFKYSSNYLKGNKEFAVKAIKINPNIFKYLEDHLQQDIELIWLKTRFKLIKECNISDIQFKFK
jgi:hypothetical protein